MSSSKLVLQGAAGALGAALNIEDVFSTYLYEGNGSTQTITNNIDISNEGGLVWIKSRTNANFHFLYDTERGATEALSCEYTNGQITRSTALTAFNNNGFDLGSLAASNGSGQDYVSWTFRKAPKFFDVVTWTGTGSAQNISHNLKTTVGCIIVKRTDTFSEWAVYHRGNTSNPETDHLHLNRNYSTVDDSTHWNDTAPTSSVFTVGTNTETNASGGSYVAYLFAHNDGDGDYGPDGNADIIKCGSYTGNGSSTGPEINLGFEPQYVMIKSATAANHWRLYDSMRGITSKTSSGGLDNRLSANLSDAESGSYNKIDLLPTGFQATTTDSDTNTSGTTYIYIAIRRGPMAVPHSASDVFAIDTRGGTSPTPPGYNAGFPVDMAIRRYDRTAVDNIQICSRLTQGKFLETNTSDAEATSSFYAFDYQVGWTTGNTAQSNSYSWMWRRAPKYFDVVTYKGTGVAATINHNLGVAPEMIWVKSRDQARDWEVYHSGIASDAETDYINLNQRYAAQDNANMWDDTKPTSSVFSLGISASVNNSSENYIAYLFASLSGVSKIGSYTGNGTNQTIDCGFSSGARFILIKRSDQGSGIIPAGDWHVFDTARGVIAGNDPYLEFNTTNAEVTSEDAVDPDSSGFIVNEVSGSNINTSGNTYIFYSIA